MQWLTLIERNNFLYMSFISGWENCKNCQNLSWVSVILLIYLRNCSCNVLRYIKWLFVFYLWASNHLQYIGGQQVTPLIVIVLFRQWYNTLSSNKIIPLSLIQLASPKKMLECILKIWIEGHISNIGTALVMMRQYWSIVWPCVNGSGGKCLCVNGQITKMATVTVIS